MASAWVNSAGFRFLASQRLEAPQKPYSLLPTPPPTSRPYSLLPTPYSLPPSIGRWSVGRSSVGRSVGRRSSVGRSSVGRSAGRNLVIIYYSQWRLRGSIPQGFGSWPVSDLKLHRPFSLLPTPNLLTVILDTEDCGPAQTNRSGPVLASELGTTSRGLLINQLQRGEQSACSKTRHYSAQWQTIQQDCQAASSCADRLSRT